MANDLEEDLRQAILNSGMTLYAVAKGSGVDKNQVGRFVAGTRSLQLPAASKIAGFLGLRLTPSRKNP